MTSPSLDAPVDPDLEAIVNRLFERAPEWATTDPDDVAGLLARCRRNLAEQAEELVGRATASKHLPEGSPWAGEEWLTGPWAIATSLRAYGRTLRDIGAGRRPVPSSTRTRPDGQVVATVFPATIADRLVLSSVTAEVWMQPDVTADGLASTIAPAYFTPAHHGEVALVLGGGNVNSIPVLDTLYELVAHRRVVVLKLNPVNDYLEAPLRAVLAPLVDAGFLAIVTGGTAVGQYLVHHPSVDKVHITGSAASHDSIVFGPGEDGARRRQLDRPLLDKPLSSELGGVGPVLVVPGPWSSADVAHHAQNIATMRLHNAGANCVAAQVLVLPGGWEPGRRLTQEIEEAFATLPPRPVYYPHSEERLRLVADAEHPGARTTVAHDGARRRILITDIDPDSEDPGFTDEAFTPILYQTSLPSTDALDFLNRAIDFANDRLMGTLGATILIHPATRRQLGAAFEDAIARLRYGSIGVNTWNAAAFLIPDATWGAFPGHRACDIQSGTDVVHNGRLFARAQKSVVTGPFTPFPRAVRNRELTAAPRPPWFVSHPRAASIGRSVTRFELTGRVRHLLRLAVDAFTP